MVHLKIHFSVRAEKDLDKEKHWQFSVDICVHTQNSVSHTTEHYLFLTTQGWLHTDISVTPGWLFLWLQAFDPSNFDARLHNTSHFDLAHRMSSYMITPFTDDAILLTCYSGVDGPGCFFHIEKQNCFPEPSSSVPLWETSTWSAETITTVKKQLRTTT